jgi:hypothetical protein
MIRATTDEFPNSWDESLPWVLFAYREIPVETSGFSPFEMLFGDTKRGPLSLVKSNWKPSAVTKAKPNVLEYILNVRESMKICRELAESTTKLARGKSKLWYDRKARERVYEPGQLVFGMSSNPVKPLEAKLCGPYRILEQTGGLFDSNSGQREGSAGLSR